MKKNIMTVLTPDFYNDFHCVAGACRHNCCVHPWTISIGKKNYKQMRRLKEPKWLTESFSSYIKRDDNNSDNNYYAHAVYNEHGCAMQTEDGLCRLQADLGAEYLSKTCQSYPRTDTYLILSAIGEVQREQCLTISCEEVARMLLNKPEPIQFITSDEEYNLANLENEHRHINFTATHDGTRPTLTHYSLIRAVGIAVLQNRDYTIEQRLILLVVYLDKLAQTERSDSADSIPAMTNTFVAAVDERLYDQLFATAPIPAVTAMLTNFASIYAFASSIDSEIVKRCNAYIETIDYDVRTENYRKFIHGKEHLLEHLLVTEFFGKMMPFTSSRSIDDCICYLVSTFTIFRFMLGGYLGEQHTLTEVEFVDFVAYFGKTVLHSSGNFSTNIALLKINGMDSLAYMLAIILG